MPSFRLGLSLGCILFSCQISGLVYALPDDRNQVAKVSANKASLDQQKHRGEYIGEVCFDQGTTHLRADKALTLGNKENHLSFAVAYGKQGQLAHYWERTSNDKPELHAFAEEIRYYPERHLIRLIGKARVLQGKDSFSAPNIDFDTEKQQVMALGNSKERIHIIMHTGKKHG